MWYPTKYCPVVVEDKEFIFANYADPHGPESGRQYEGNLFSFCPGGLDGPADMASKDTSLFQQDPGMITTGPFPDVRIKFCRIVMKLLRAEGPLTINVAVLGYSLYRTWELRLALLSSVLSFWRGR